MHVVESLGPNHGLGVRRPIMTDVANSGVATGTDNAPLLRPQQGANFRFSSRTGPRAQVNVAHFLIEEELTRQAALEQVQISINRNG